MSWEPTTEWGFCPACGRGPIEVNTSRNDYYQGDLYRCPDGHAFYALPGEDFPDPPPRPRGENPSLDALEDLLRASVRDTLARPPILLAELERKR